MTSESGSTSRAASEDLSERNYEDNANFLVKVSEEPSIITDLPVMHTAKRLKVEARKLDGMQRELYSLIGDNAPPVVLTPGSKFKTRPEWQQRAASWKLAEFSPKKGLMLKHWVRAASLADGTSGDRFSRFNTPANIPHWSESDYQYFTSETWSLDETQYLFSLAKEFDLRWLVIADRYSFNDKSRTIEELKDRYYEVCRKLIENKPISPELGLSPYDEELLNAMKFDSESEQKRKAHLERLLSRSPKEVAEEEALILEARRLEMLSGKIFTERKQLMSLLESPAPLNAKTTKADLNTSQGIGQLLQELQNEKSRKVSTPVTGTPQAVGGTNNSSKAVSAIISRPHNRKITPREEKAIGISYIDTASTKHSGVYLRSAKLTPIRQNLLPKFRAVLLELGLPIKPVMPTAKTCEKYESLYQSITILLEAKKIQDKLEMEIDVLKRARDTRDASQDVPEASEEPCKTENP